MWPKMRIFAIRTRYIDMKQYRLTAPCRLEATISLPASKSISNRALIIYALSGGKNMPSNLSDCDDTEVIINALRNMPEEIDIKAVMAEIKDLEAKRAELDAQIDVYLKELGII